MADIQDEILELRQLLSGLQTALQLQQSNSQQLRRQIAESKSEIETIITAEITKHMTDQLPDIIAQIHPNLGVFLTLFDGKSGRDIENFATDLAPLISGENAEISPQQLEHLWQNVRVLIHDTIQQQISHILARHFV